MPIKTAEADAHLGQYDLATLGGRLQFALHHKQTNPNKVELATGVKRQTLYAALKGKTQNFTWPKLELVAGHLGFRVEWLANGEMPMYPPPVLKDDDEVQLIYDFRDLSEGHRRDLAEIARRWAEEDGSGPSSHRPFPPTRPTRQ